MFDVESVRSRALRPKHERLIEAAADRGECVVELVHESKLVAMAIHTKLKNAGFLVTGIRSRKYGAEFYFGAAW